jgi:chloroplastic oxoene reductase
LTAQATSPPRTCSSGGVGLYAVQLARLAGLHVTATCGARNMELVRSLGADEVLDYRTPEGARQESPSGRRYDGVVQCADGISWSTLEPVLSDRGKVMDLSLSFSAVITAAMHKVTFARKSLVPLALSPNKADLEFLVGLLKDDGNMKTLIDSRLAMWSELVRRAWRDVPPARSWSRWKAKLSVVSPY